MLLLGVDFETTGLEIPKDRIIEVGAVLWDTDRQAPIELYNQLVNPGVAIPEIITEITGITQGDIDQWGMSGEGVFRLLNVMMSRVQAVVAHNGSDFDKPFAVEECRRYGFELGEYHWIDTTIDIPYPKKIQTRKLTHLAAEHGFVNPFAHRALSDVLTMMKILSHYDINQVLEISKLPTVKLIAVVKKPWEDLAIEGKKETDKAKARGYRWDGAKKRWAKNVKQNLVAQEKEHGEFQVEEER